MKESITVELPNGAYYEENEMVERAIMDIVRQNGMVLEYVKEQTSDICMEAVRRDGKMLKFVKKQTPELCAIARKMDEPDCGKEILTKVPRHKVKKLDNFMAVGRF